MPTTRKRHLQQQQQRAQQLQQQQQQHQQQQPPSADQHDKQNNDMDTIDCPSHQPPSKTPLIKVKVDKDEIPVPNDQAEKRAVHKDIQAILESDLYCAICREIYIDPMILNCAHSFCRFCLNHWLNKQVGCPSCRMVVVFQTENMALNDIVSKMIKTSSQEFQLERNQSLESRWAAEEQQRKLNIKPMMEARSFDEQGQPKRVHKTHRHTTIRSWRGPNGATIWRTKLDLSGQIIRPEIPEYHSSESSMSSPEDDDEVDDDEDDDDDEDYDEDYLDVGEARIYVNHGPRDDESSNSTIDIVSDESLEESQRIHMNHLNILAGNIAAESDEDFEIDEHDRSNSDSSMQGIESDSSDHSSDEFFGIWGILGRPRADMSTEEEEDDEQEEGVVPESEREEDNTDTSSSTTTSSDETSDDDSIDSQIIEGAAITSGSDSNSSGGSPSDIETSGSDTDSDY